MEDTILREKDTLFWKRDNCLLPNLKELKLKDRAAIGDVWRLRDDDIFESLKLLFRKVVLANWVASSDNFPSLKCLVLKKCDNLQEIPIDFGEICTLESIELHNCSTSAEDSARKIEQEQEDMGNNCLNVYITLNDPESIHHLFFKCPGQYGVSYWFEVWHRNVTENTLKAIKKIDKIKVDREERHIAKRMKGKKAKEQREAMKELE
ncbi:hypothetical protein CQW23_25011 [Capsicum baccatum]|uniref:NB-ARC domain-containing protein n=1 Tax=Capsicum baccatum TaxID=33114 RepID=A0A2G2VWH0_CAPBA|nr:hypothetical protein CQW23_25011 [Capsicum baccatum]